jgi:hypothetical protein
MGRYVFGASAHEDDGTEVAQQTNDRVRPSPDFRGSGKRSRETCSDISSYLAILAAAIITFRRARAKVNIIYGLVLRRKLFLKILD